MAGWDPDRVGARCRSHARRAADGAAGTPGSGRLGDGRAPRDRTAPGGTRSAQRRGAARRGTGVRRGDGPDRAGAVDRARYGAAGRRRAFRRGRSGRLGPCQHRLVRLAHRQARARPARSGRAGRRRLHGRRDGARQSMDHDPPARRPARVHGPARARPIRPRAAVRGSGTGAPPVRRGEHPPDGQGTRRPVDLVPHVDRTARDDPRLRVRGPPMAPAVPRVTAGAAADLVRPRRARDGPGSHEGSRARAPRRGWRRTLDGTPDDGRAEGALP